MDNVKCICFNMTSSKTDLHSEACILIEQILAWSLLYFACRHHTLKVLLVSVVSKSSGPEIQLFKRFKANWKKIVRV